MIEQKLNRLYESCGYRKFKMSKFEPYDLYADNRDFLKSSQLITFTDLDGSLLALKPDVTLSIVKANAGGEEKVYYNETVYRPKDRHYREIQQTGVECLGPLDRFAEAEVIALAAQSLALVSDRFVIRISDAAFLKQLFESMELSDSTCEAVLRLFSMKNAAGFDGLVEEGRMTRACAETLKQLVDLYAPFREGIEALSGFAMSNSAARLVAHLRGLAEVLESFGVLQHIYLDFSLVNSMDYYNGIIFQGAAENIPFTVLSGGRYDRLPEKMGKKVGAIGFAMYLDMVENYLSVPKHYDVDLLLLYEGEDNAVGTAARAAALRSRGLRVRVIRADALELTEHPIRRRATGLPDGGYQLENGEVCTEEEMLQRLLGADTDPAAASGKAVAHA